MSDLLPSEGYETIEQEFEARLRKAFVDGHADFVRVDSRRQRFQLESMAWAEEKGWMKTELKELDEQSSEYRGRLTPEGRKHFGLADAA
jgi:hypothetical protein